jgi:hypothetical protein
MTATFSFGLFTASYDPEISAQASQRQLERDSERFHSFPYVPAFTQVYDNLNKCLYESLEVQVQKASDIFYKTIPADSGERMKDCARLKQSVDNIRGDVEFYRNRIQALRLDPLIRSMGSNLTSLQLTLGYGQENIPNREDQIRYEQILLGNDPINSPKIPRNLRSFESLVDQFEDYIEPFESKIIQIENLESRRALTKKLVTSALALSALIIASTTAYFFLGSEKKS